MAKKKKVGNLYGRPLVEGDPNYIKGKEILVKKEDKYITLAERKKIGLQTLSNVSTVGENYGIATFKSTGTSMVAQAIYNPSNIQEVFNPLPSLSYSIEDKQGVSIIRDILAELWGLLEHIPIIKIAEEAKWVDTDIIKSLIKDNMNFSYADTLSVDICGITVIAPMIQIRLPYAAFENGHLMGVGTTTDSSTLEQIDFQDLHFSSINYKGDAVEDKFEIAGTTKNTAMNVATDESYVVVKNAILLISPLINAAFTVGVLTGTSDLVLINCIKMDTSFMRKALRIPESAVISSKEGAYIKYPNIYVPEETNTRMRNSNSRNNSMNDVREMLLNVLKKQVASLEAAIKKDEEVESTDES